MSAATPSQDTSTRGLPWRLVVLLNLWAWVCCAGAFFAWLSGGDSWFVIVLAVMGLPALLLQPWFFLLFFASMPASCYLAPLASIAIGVFYVPYARRFRPYDWAIGWLRPKVLVPYFAIFGLVLASRWFDYPHLGPDMTGQAEWAFSGIPQLPEDGRLMPAGHIRHPAWIWSGTLSEAQFKVLRANLELRLEAGLVPCTPNAPGPEFDRSRPIWWKPRLDESSTLLISPGFADPANCCEMRQVVEFDPRTGATHVFASHH